MTTGPQGTAARRADSSRLGEDRGNLYGIMVMQVTMFFFVTTDTLTKLVGDALAPGQVIVIRGLVSLLGLAAILVWSGDYRHMRQALHPVILLRALCEAGAAIMFVIALVHLPLANISAILLTIPLATTAAAALFFNEMVGIRRWSAIAVGFVGVLAIVRPGLEGFTIYSLFALAAVIGASARDLATRRIPLGTSIWVVTFATMFLATFAGAVLGLTESWAPVTVENFLYLAGAAIFLTLAQITIVIAMNSGEVSVVSSFRYIAMPFSLVYGFVIWGETPDLLTWFGIALILAAGLYTIMRERQLARARNRDQTSSHSTQSPEQEIS